MRDDAELLRQYVQAGSEDAFTELVHRHLPVVYGSALRQTGGDADLAKDICQTVFIDLARKARLLLGHELLIAWLFTATRFTAAGMLRADRRRQVRESVAVSMRESTTEPVVEHPQLASALDAALAELAPEDRDAILLRFFQNKPLKDVGSALGINEDAARMRVSRALDKLHTLLDSRGVTISAAALGSILATEAATAVPAGLAATISAAALAGTTLTTAATATAAKALAMTTLQKTLVTAFAAAALLAGTATYLLQERTANRLRTENQNLLAQQQALLADRDAALAAAKARPDSPEQPQVDKGELLRLRGEVGLLRNENRQLRASLEKNAGSSPNASANPEITAMMQRGRDAKILAGVLIAGYAQHHDGQFPTNWVQATPYLNQALRNDLSPGDVLRDVNEFVQLTNQFQIVYQGKWDTLTNMGDVIVLRENEPRQYQGKWVRAYSFADGHSDMIPEPEGGFDAWERAHGLQSTGPAQ